jgi:alpha/beta superfamily hydrolase
MTPSPPESLVSIPSSDAVLDGRLALPTAPRAGVVLCHPHPAFHGTMHSSVIQALASRLSAAGYATLRFDFRGVGRSTGTPTAGDREGEDVLAATAYLRGRGVAPICVAGYSFGAAAALDAAWRGGDFAATACIGFPTEAIAVGSPEEARVREAIAGTEHLLFISGTVDPYSSPDLLEAWGARVERLLAVGHFYSRPDEERIVRRCEQLFLEATVRLA